MHTSGQFKVMLSTVRLVGRVVGPGYVAGGADAGVDTGAIATWGRSFDWMFLLTTNCVSKWLISPAVHNA